MQEEKQWKKYCYCNFCYSCFLTVKNGHPFWGKRNGRATLRQWRGAATPEQGTKVIMLRGWLGCSSDRLQRTKLVPAQTSNVANFRNFKHKHTTKNVAVEANSDCHTTSVIWHRWRLFLMRDVKHVALSSYSLIYHTSNADAAPAAQ